MVCFDEWGPLEVKPMGGLAWARRRHPHRMRATYRRQQGTEQFLGFYDVHADCLSGLFRKHKRLPELGEAFRRLRACYPRRRLLVIMDNLHNTHDHPPLFGAAPTAPDSPGVDTNGRLVAEPHRGAVRCPQALHPAADG